MPLPGPDFWYGVAATALIAALSYYFGVRRRKLSITYDVTPLIPEGGKKLAVTWDGQQVANPFILHVRLEASWAGDITPSHFAGGGVVLGVGDAHAIGVLETDDSPPCSVSDTRVAIEPFLLKRGKSSSATFLASGEEPQIQPEKSKLSDASISIRSWDESFLRPIGFTGVFLVLLGLLAFATRIIPGYDAFDEATFGQTPASPASWIFLGSTTIAFGGGVLAYFWLRVRRLRAGRKPAA